MAKGTHPADQGGGIGGIGLPIVPHNGIHQYQGIFARFVGGGAELVDDMGYGMDLFVATQKAGIDGTEANAQG